MEVWQTLLFLSFVRPTADFAVRLPGDATTLSVEGGVSLQSRFAELAGPVMRFEISNLSSEKR